MFQNLLIWLKFLLKKFFLYIFIISLLKILITQFLLLFLWAGNARSSILLTGAGTKEYFINRKSYVNEMSTNIASALAVESERISIPNDRYQYMQNTLVDQILLLVIIKGSKTPGNPSSFTLREDLDGMVLFQEIVLFYRAGLPRCREKVI